MNQNNKMSGFSGLSIVASEIERFRLDIGEDLASISRRLNRIANALERANEIHIDTHALPVEVFDEVQAKWEEQGTE